MEGHCRARLANAAAALEFGDLNEAASTLSPLWRCSTYSDCKLRPYCAIRVGELTDRIHDMPPVPQGNA
jgi:hypothetical protein